MLDLFFLKTELYILLYRNFFSHVRGEWLLPGTERWGKIEMLLKNKFAVMQNE